MKRIEYWTGLYAIWQCIKAATVTWFSCPALGMALVLLTVMVAAHHYANE